MHPPLINTPVKHWCEFEFIAKTVTNPNIHIKGHYSYYSAYWDQGFERCVVRYLHDKPSTQEKPIDQLYIGNFVCFGAECVIMMGGNQLHRPDWIFTFRDCHYCINNYCSYSHVAFHLQILFVLS